MEPGRFRWFGKNTFFANSSLTGLLFINEAKSRWEKMFWYCLLLVFATLTIGNAVNFVKYYQSRPIQTVARVATSSEDVTLPAMQLELTTSLDMFGWDFIMVPALTMDNFICNNTQPYLIANRLKRQQNLGVRGAELRNETFLPMLIDFCQKNSNTGARASDILSRINKRSFLLRTVLEAHRYTTLRSYGNAELAEISTNLLRALSQIEPPYLVTQVYLALLFLAQLNQDSRDVRRLLLQKNKYIEELENSKKTITQLLEAVDSCFKEYLIVEAEEAYGQVSMRDWTVNLTAGTQTAVYDIRFDAESHAKRATINVYATKLNRYLVMIREVLLHLTRVRAIWIGDNDNIAYECHNCWGELGGKCAANLYCDTYHDEWTFKTMIQEIVPNTTYSKRKYVELLERYIAVHTVRPVLQNIEKNTRLKIVMPHGRVDVPPLHQNNLTLQISGRFVSLLEGCVNSSTANCADKCAYEQHIDTCGCYPWTLRHMQNGGDSQICTETCAQTQQIYSNCAQSCKEQLGQACQTTIMYSQVLSKPLQHAKLESVIDELGVSFWVLFTDSLLPMATIDVDLKDDRYYAVYVEKYSMTLNEFVSQLGGLLEFWLGINVTGMIHLIFYIMRQCYRARDSQSKTNRDWRRFLGLTPIENQNQNSATLNEIIASNEATKQAILDFQANTESNNVKLKTNRMHGISRLFKANFLEETPLVGFSFIYNAKSKLEAYMWCVIIFALSVLTVRNLIVAGVDFSQGATKTSLQMLYSEQKFENITLTVTTSVYEFLNSVPITLKRQRIGGNRTNGVYFHVDNVPCIQASKDYVKKDIKHHIIYALANIMDKMSTSGQLTLIEKIEHLRTNQNKFQFARWGEWKKRYNTVIRQNLNVFWETFRLHIEDVPSNLLGPLVDEFLPYETAVFEAEILEAILNDTDRDREFMKDTTDVILPLFMSLELMHQNDSEKINYLLQSVGPYHLLQALTGADMYGIRDIRLTYGTERLLDSFMKISNVTFANSQMLADRFQSLGALVRLTENLIPLFLDIRADDPNTKLDLRRVNFMSDGRVRLTLQVSVADGAQTDRIKFLIHSFQLARTLFYLKSLTDHLTEYGKLEQRGKCTDSCHKQIYCNPHDFWFIYDSEFDLLHNVNGPAISEYVKLNQRQISGEEMLKGGEYHFILNHVRAIHLLHKNAVTDLLNHYKETTSIWLTTQSGVTMFEPFWYHQSTLLPATDFESNIHNCYEGTRDHCTQSCLLDAHLELCDCGPWHLHYLNPRGSICHKPCPSAQEKENECVEKCIQLTSHQCSIPMRREQRNRQPITHFQLEHEAGYDKAVVEPTLPLASIELRLGKLQHPCVTEEYAMTPSGFISRLGGLMEIWLGFNIVALIHLMIYGVKHSGRITQTKSKTGRIVRKIVGGEEDMEGDQDTDVYEAHEEIKDKWNQLQNALQTHE